MPEGFVDLHCHLLWGLDDGAKTLADSLEMARALVGLGFSTVAASPHNRPEFAPRPLALQRLDEVQQELTRSKIPLTLAPNSENYLVEDRFLPSIGSAEARLIGRGPYVLVEAPYTSPVPALTEIVFRIKLKGITPLFAHPERCMEFERKGRAAEAVQAGALLQLDVGALIGRYGPKAKKLAREFLDDGLYAVAATDLHSPHGAADWVGRSIDELRKRAGEGALAQLMREHPRAILEGRDKEAW